MTQLLKNQKLLKALVFAYVVGILIFSMSAKAFVNTVDILPSHRLGLQEVEVNLETYLTSAKGQLPTPCDSNPVANLESRGDAFVLNALSTRGDTFCAQVLGEAFQLSFDLRSLFAPHIDQVKKLETVEVLINDGSGDVLEIPSSDVLNFLENQMDLTGSLFSLPQN